MQSHRTAATAGALYGVLMGGFFAFQTWNKGASPEYVAAVGLGSTLGMGLLFGLLMYAFSRWMWVRKQIELQPQDLLPGERLIESRLANLVVDPRDFGLRKFALGDLMFLAGLQGKEVVGGALHLTNLRLLFKAHRLNRLRGAVSVFLPSVQRLGLQSRWPFRRLRVSTGLLEVEFALTDAAALQQRIEAARSAFSAVEQAQLQSLQGELPGIEQLQTSAALDALNTLIHRGRLGSDVVATALTPLTTLAGVFASEMFDRGLAQRWSERMK